MALLDCFRLLKKEDNDSCTSKSKNQQVVILGYSNLGISSFKNAEFSTIDVKSSRVRKVSDLGANSMMSNSCNGLILLTSYFCKHHVIFNPISNQIVKSITTPVWLSGYPCGFFYHPLAKEYRILYVVKVDDENNNHRYEYHIYLSGCNTWRPALNPYFYWMPSKGRAFLGAEVIIRPTNTKQALYWYRTGGGGCSGDIMVFDIIGEEFCFKPLPVCCVEQANLHEPTLVAKDEDCLCCCYMHRAELSIDVWVLEDYANWSWNRKYVVNLDFCKTNKYPSEAWRSYASSIMHCVRVVSIQKDELVLSLVGGFGRVYSYHLESGFLVATQLSKADMEKYMPGKDKGRSYDRFYGFIGL